MQIGNNYSLYSPSFTSSASPAKAKTEGQDSGSFYKQLADYDDPKNTLFQNLLKDPTVQDNIAVNDDGTYEFVWDGKTPTSQKEGIVKHMIEEQNDTYYKVPGAITYSDNEVAMFRQLTGYNLVTAAGGETIADDYGNPVPERDIAMVMAAWDMFGLANAGNELEHGEDSDFTVADLKLAAEGLASQPGANKALFDSLIEMIDKNLTGDSEKSS